MSIPANRANTHNSSAVTLPRDYWPAAVADVLLKVQRLLDQGEIDGALNRLAHAKVESPWLRNAQGVCLLRRDRPDEAVRLFRTLVLNATGIGLRSDTPALFNYNFALSLLGTGNVTGCESTLREMDLNHQAHAAHLQELIRQAYRSGSWWQRWQWRLWGLPADRIKLDFNLGEL